MRRYLPLVGSGGTESLVLEYALSSVQNSEGQRACYRDCELFRKQPMRCQNETAEARSVSAAG